MDTSAVDRVIKSQLNQTRAALRDGHYRYRTRLAYLDWLERYLAFHGTRAATDADPAGDITAFLRHLSIDRRSSSATQKQALGAILFFYRRVLGRELRTVGLALRAALPEPAPVLLTPADVDAVLARLHGTPHLVVALLYGACLSLTECLQLRVNDIDVDRGDIVARGGPAANQRRVVPVPDRARLLLVDQLHAVRQLFARDRRDGICLVLPEGIRLRYPLAVHDWTWQYVFPAGRASRDPRTGDWRRGRMHDVLIQRAVRGAVRAARVTNLVRCDTFRQSREAHLRLEARDAACVDPAGNTDPMR